MSPPPVTNYWGVHGVGPQETWVCGESLGAGIVSHWSKTEGWSFTSPVASTNLRGIWMCSDISGYCIGSTPMANPSAVWKWNGSSWTVVWSGTQTVYAIHGHVTITGALGNAYVVCNGGHVYKVPPVGMATHYIIPAAYDIYAVHVINDDTVWVCGEDGHVSVSTDGGTTWTTYHTGIIQDLKGIWVSDDQHTIRVVGDNGTLLISIDGGTTWNAETFQGSGQGLTAISMSNNGQMGYICGLLGTILQNNAQPLGYTLENGVFYSNGDLLYGTILESRHGRRNYVDVLVWNVYYGSTTYYGETTYSFTGKNYDLLWELLDSIKPAHIKLFLIPSFPFIMDYYYYYKDFYRDRLQKDHILQDVNEGGCIVVNGRVYGDSLSQVVIGEEELYIPQLE